MSGTKDSWLLRRGVPIVTLSTEGSRGMWPLREWTPCPILRREQVTPEKEAWWKVVESVWPDTRVQIDGILRPVK